MDNSGPAFLPKDYVRPTPTCRVLLELECIDGFWVIKSEQIPGLYLAASIKKHKESALPRLLSDLPKSWELLAEYNKGVAPAPSKCVADALLAAQKEQSK